MSQSNRKPKLLTRVVKGIGHYLGPETPTGKAFVALEKGLSKGFDRLGKSELFLDTVGGGLNRSLRARKLYVDYQENMLHAWRLPTVTEMDELRADVRDLRDQLEAVSSQLELVLEALEAQRKQPPAPEVAAQKPTKNGTAEAKSS